MCAAAASSLRCLLPSQCATGGRMRVRTFQVSKESGHCVFFPRSALFTMLATQESNAREFFQCHAQSRNAQRCFVSKYRADFSTSNGDIFPTKEREEPFVERFKRAWSVLFPAKSKPSSNKDIAKQRLKMILVSDRCSVNDEAKKKIVNNIVGALSDFVEIQSEEKVQVDLTSDAELNTVCSVTVPVRRVRPEYQEFSRELANEELKAFDYDEEEGFFRMVGIRFERPDVEDIQI